MTSLKQLLDEARETERARRYPGKLSVDVADRVPRAAPGAGPRVGWGVGVGVTAIAMLIVGVLIVTPRDRQAPGASQDRAASAAIETAAPRGERVAASSHRPDRLAPAMRRVTDMRLGRFTDITVNFAAMNLSPVTPGRVLRPGGTGQVADSKEKPS